MSDAIGNRYFRWLYDQVFREFDQKSLRSYITVCTEMHSVPFNDSVPNDSNRSRDAEELREEFISTFRRIDLGDYAWIYGMGQPSVFEVLIALARSSDIRYSEVDSWEGVAEWFLLFIDNLGLIRFPDGVIRPEDIPRIRKIIRIMNDRTYSRKGKGGIFPLRKTGVPDQRHVELHYQQSAYMEENRMY